MKSIVLRTTILVAAIAAMGSPTAAFANTAELKVTGVISPGACLPTLGGAGVVPYGNIARERLAEREPTVLATKSVTLTIHCDNASSVMVSAVDNKGPTKQTALFDKIPQAQESSMFGLGQAGEQKIGAYRIAFSTFTVDATPSRTITSTDGIQNWAQNSTSGFQTGRFHAWAPATGVAAPGTFKDIIGSLLITPVINPASQLPTSGAINLDGNATLTLKYL